MILYDKKSNFLGMGQSELSMLGYEDMEEFKSYFDDFADLFIDQPGYISKFKNFSWIDYTLHSGAPNKNVLLKHKNGTNIETHLQISEIYLLKDINEETTLYCIELGVNTSSPDPVAKQNIKLSDTSNDIQEPTTNVNFQEPETHLEIHDNTHNFDEILIEDFKESGESDKETLLESPEEKEDAHDNNTDNNIFEENENLDDDFSSQNDIANSEDTFVSDIKISSIEESQPTRLKVVFDDEDDRELQVKASHENDAQDFSSNSISQNTDDTNIMDFEPEEIDLTQIAEDTGMDLGDIAEFMEDFIQESKNFLKKFDNIENMSDENLFKNETVKIKGVASNLKINYITNTLTIMLETKEKGRLSNLLELFKKQIKNLEEQLF